MGLRVMWRGEGRCSSAFAHWVRSYKVGYPHRAVTSPCGWSTFDRPGRFCRSAPSARKAYGVVATRYRGRALGALLQGGGQTGVKTWLSEAG
jgi:hypothetical protein